jgi:hypothetical protein
MANKTAAITNKTAVAILFSLYFFRRIRRGGRTVFQILHLGDNVLYQPYIHHHKQERQKRINYPFGNVGYRAPRRVGIHPLGQGIQAGKDDTVKNYKDEIINYQQYQPVRGVQPVQYYFQPQMLIPPDGGSGTEINGQDKKYQCQFFGPGKRVLQNIPGKNLQEQQQDHNAQTKGPRVYLKGIEQFQYFFHGFSIFFDG